MFESRFASRRDTWGIIFRFEQETEDNCDEIKAVKDSVTVSLFVLQWDEQACISCHGFRQATLLDDDDDADDNNDDDCDDDGDFRTRVEDDNDDE